MSKSNRTSMRKILSTETFTTTIAGVTLPVTQIFYCFVSDSTSRTVKTTNIGYKIYIGKGSSNSGFDCWMPRKPVSINLKNPLSSKFFKDRGDIKRTQQKAFSDAWTSYVLSHPELSKGLTATVSYYDNDRGEGSVHIPLLGISLPVYGCNIKGAKTGYPETACMNLERGQTVTLDITGDPYQLFACVTEGGIFDAEKWASLDQDNLAFKMNETGEFTSGLFE